MIVDAYAAEVLKATDHGSIPKPVRGWPNIKVFIPQRQRIHLVRKNIAPIVDSYRSFRLWPENLAEQAPHSVMLFRPWMFADLDRAKALTGASVIWSQWDGYLNEGSGAQLEADCKARGIPFEVIHTSGHASIGDLKRLVGAVAPKALVPIHTFGAERFPDLFDNVVLRQDGESWEV
jgi:ribonuclease J